MQNLAVKQPVSTGLWGQANIDPSRTRRLKFFSLRQRSNSVGELENYCVVPSVVFLSILGVEGIRIGQLSHSEPYKAKTGSDDVDKNAEDDYILRKLFKKSGKTFFRRFTVLPVE